MKFLITGSIAYDYLMTFPGYFKDQILPDQIENISLSFLVDSMVRRRGGVAPNIAYTMALLGERPMVMGTVGQDFSDYRAWLEEHGIDTAHIKTIDNEYTASFFANTDRSNSQISSFYTGAMAYAVSQSITDLGDTAVDLVIISPNDPRAMDKLVMECQQCGQPYLYDPSQQLARISSEEIIRGTEKAKLLFVNEYEFSLLQHHTGKSAEQLVNEIEIIVVTRGENGTSIYVSGEEHKVKAVEPKIIADPTGIGDAFRGGFLKGYGLGFDWKTCGQMGSLAATYCLENTGTQSHYYTPREFVTRYRQHYDDNGKLDLLLN